MKMTKKDFVYKLTLPIALLSFSLIFLSGIFSSKTKVEEVSHYTSEVVKTQTLSKNLLSVVIKKSNISGSLPNSDNEFHNLYGAFKEQEITFVSTINATKNLELFLSYNGEQISNCLSMQYFGPLGTIEYKGFYKHYTYPLQLMFSDDKSSYDVSKYILNISQTQANKILLNKGLIPNNDGNFDIDEYKTLIRSKCQVQNGDLTVDFCINNIYLETNYYYEGLRETINDFVMVSYYLPWNLRNEQENCYFFTADAYQNSYFMKYINNVYGLDKYSISINKNNVVGDVDYSKILSFNSEINSKLNWLSILLAIISVALVIYCLVFTIVLSNDSWKRLLIKSVVLLLPYFCFWIIYKITNNLLIFSLFSCELYLFLFLAVILIGLVSFLIKRRVFIINKDCVNEIKI